ncbi:hypothetical protein QA612_17785 [Evansella sp. AB-P1]|uniref:hypothetical protein n=1 Tax=Evansella sp. AB-P1 TaxID=3037653 RepID=UPI00241C48C4|nr:hypothetical protein [Evansella sp. AB-P1]MDG5789315.1 hypothetical protein [Evansella sp. AB-P1]
MKNLFFIVTTILFLLAMGCSTNDESDSQSSLSRDVTAETSTDKNQEYTEEELIEIAKSIHQSIQDSMLIEDKEEYIEVRSNYSMNFNPNRPDVYNEIAELVTKFENEEILEFDEESFVFKSTTTVYATYLDGNTEILQPPFTYTEQFVIPEGENDFKLFWVLDYEE